MKTSLSISILSLLAILNTSHAMEIPSLKILAARVIAQECDPEKKYDKALVNLHALSLYNFVIEPLIHQELFKNAQQRLKTILANQIPIEITLFKYDELPETVAATPDEGLLIRRKKKASFDQDHHLYLSMGAFFPDPLQSETNQYCCLKANAIKSLYFQNIGDSSSKVWDAHTGACITDCAAVRAELRTYYPNATMWIEGIADNRIAVARFGYTAEKDSEEDTGICFFDIYKNKILTMAHGCRFFELSSDDSHIVVENQKRTTDSSVFKVVNFNTRQFQRLNFPHGDFFCRAISPANNYLILQHRLVGMMCIYNMSSKLPSLLMPDLQGPLSTERHKSSMSPDDKFFALVNAHNDKEIILINMQTGKSLYCIPISQEPLKLGEDLYTTFTPDSKKLLIYKSNLFPAKDTLKTWDIATQEFSETIELEETCDPNDSLMFCNDEKYLLLPTQKLLIQPKGLAAHLSLKELMSLLIIEKNHTQKMPFCVAAWDCLQKNQLPKIKELINNRYKIE